MITSSLQKKCVKSQSLIPISSPLTLIGEGQDVEVMPQEAEAETKEGEVAELLPQLINQMIPRTPKLQIALQSSMKGRKIFALRVIL